MEPVTAKDFLPDFIKAIINHETIAFVCKVILICIILFVAVMMLKKLFHKIFKI